MSFKVSVIIPVYNVEKYLPACLESVLAQSLKKIEILCVDDCTPDNSSEILSSYAKKDNRLSVITNDINLGLAGSRNVGLEKCQGEYVFFLDSDDMFFAEDSLENLYAIASEDFADEIIGGMLRWNEETEEREYGYHASCLKQLVRKGLFRDNQHLRANVTACNKLFKKSFLDEYGLRFNSGLRKFEDNSFSWRAHLLARSISLTPQPTYLHRQRSGNGPLSLMQSKKNDVVHHVLAAEDILEFLEKEQEFLQVRHNIDVYFFYWLRADLKEVMNGAFDPVQIKMVFRKYLPVLERIPDKSLSVMPEWSRKTLMLMKEGELDKAVQILTMCGEKQQEENAEERALKEELEKVYNSLSWRLTAPLRNLAGKLSIMNL